MPLLTPTKGRPRIITNGGIVGTNAPGTGVASGVADTEGSVVELISAANNIQDSYAFMVFITGSGLSGTASQAAIDILVGGATDDVLVNNLICGYSVLGASQSTYYFPVHIPAGLRIAAKIAGARASFTAQVLVWLFGGQPPPHRTGRKVTTYGTAINNSRGQAVVPTASGGAASVTQMTASTSEDHFALIPGFQPATDTTITPAGYVNIGIGVGASTEERIGTWWYGKDTGENVSGPWPPMPVYQDVPAGTRLTLLASNSGANDAAYDGFVYAVS